MTSDLTKAGEPPATNQPASPRPGLSALREFVDSNVLGGILLLAAAVVAVVWSNSPASQLYDDLLHAPVTVGVGQVALTLSVHAWINDALMAIFFLVVGLEIKRELQIGELNSARRALLPAGAAIGGAVLPAAIFLLIVGPSAPGARGWGIPMATDIAFALGVLALVGNRVPLGMRVFVTALAIVDDLLAVLVIAIFYTAELSVPALVASAVVVTLLIAMNRLGVRSLVAYGVAGVALWLAVHESGIHATVGGVLLALTIPGPRGSGRPEDSPLVRLEHSLNRVSAFVIVPIFALANAGVTIQGDLLAVLTDPIAVAVVAGLVIGKQVGITSVAWLLVRTRLAALPDGVRWAHVYGASWVCAIGFTMSLFIAALAYGESDALASAKVGVLAASIVAGTVGYGIVRYAARR